MSDEDIDMQLEEEEVEDIDLNEPALLDIKQGNLEEEKMDENQDSAGSSSDSKGRMKKYF